MLKRFTLLPLLAALFLVVGACSQSNEEDQAQKNNELNNNTQKHEEGKDHADMDHSGSGEVPEGLKVAENPTYKVGSHAILKDGHMEGMKGAEATIVGAYDTTAYSVSFTPATGGEKIKNHKWIIHEEIKDSGKEPLQPGTEAVTTASHMEGMKGTTVDIESAKPTTVYMIDYKPTTGEKK